MKKIKTNDRFIQKIVKYRFDGKHFNELQWEYLKQDFTKYEDYSSMIYVTCKNK